MGNFIYRRVETYCFRLRLLRVEKSGLSYSHIKNAIVSGLVEAPPSRELLQLARLVGP